MSEVMPGGAAPKTVTAITTLNADGTVPAAGTALSVESAIVTKGYQQLTSTAASATVASLCSGAALPTGASKMIVVPTANVRFRDDGTNPSATVGFPVAAGQSWVYDGDKLSAMKVYGAATLDVLFYA